MAITEKENPPVGACDNHFALAKGWDAHRATDNPFTLAKGLDVRCASINYFALAIAQNGVRAAGGAQRRVSAPTNWGWNGVTCELVLGRLLSLDAVPWRKVEVWRKIIWFCY
jgi:hypothetical protein